MANEAWRQWTDFGCAINFRDPGEQEMISRVQSSGREVYTVSADGHKSFFWSVRKSGIPSAMNQRVAALWSGDEFLYSVKLGLSSLGASHPLGIDYVMEGHRRYGGSARLVLEFAKLLKANKRTKDNLEEEPMPHGTHTLLRVIAESAVTGNDEDANKLKATVFHQSPVGNTFRVHFASPYIGQQLMNKVKSRCDSQALKTVVDALSTTEGLQDAYGLLYEYVVHRLCATGTVDGVQKRATLLGCHGPSSLKKESIVAKRDVTLNFARQNGVYVPGHSLQNACLESADAPLLTYFQPMAWDFPTHDSFILCPASDFFEAASSLGVQKRLAIEKYIAEKVVLVGLQTTVVSGTTSEDAATDKPSHPVDMTHLTSALEAIETVLANHHPTLHILPDVVTFFCSPHYYHNLRGSLHNWK